LVIALSGRISKLLERHLDLEHVQYRMYSKLSIWDHGADSSESIVIRKAEGLKFLLEETPAIIMDEELIVGLRTLYGQVEEGANVLRGTYMLPVNPATDHKKAFYASYLTDDEASEAHKYGILEGSYTSHIPFGTAMVMELGLGGIKEKAVERMGPGNTDAQNDFLKAVVLSFDAISDFISKHAEETRRLAEAAGSGARRDELLMIAESIQRISSGPATSFRDAVQLFWLCTVVMAVESQSCLPIGRLDYDLWPYLEADLDSGGLPLD